MSYSSTPRHKKYLHPNYCVLTSLLASDSTATSYQTDHEIKYLEFSTNDIMSNITWVGGHKINKINYEQPPACNPHNTHTPTEPLVHCRQLEICRRVEIIIDRDMFSIR